jgi:conjugal transfer ATP-binding protein TraC
MLNSVLSDRLELWGFEGSVMVFKDFSLGQALELLPIDVSCADASTINVLQARLRQLLNGCPSGLSIQFVQEVSSGYECELQQHSADSSYCLTPLVADMTEARVAKFREFDLNRELPRQKLFLFLRRSFEKPPSLSLFSTNQKENRLNENRLTRELESFERIVCDLQSSLEAIGVQGEILNEADVFSMIYRQWNPDRPVEAKATQTEDVRDQLCLTDVVIGLDHFVLGKTFHKVISLKNLPEQTFASMAEVLRSLPFNSVLYLSIEVLDQQKEISNLSLQRRIAYSSVMGKKGAADLDAKAKLTDIESILAEMIQGREKVFKVALNICVRNEDVDLLESQVAVTLSCIRELSGAEGMVETHGAFDIFNEFSLPNARGHERAVKVSTSTLGDLVPVYGLWRGHSKPSVLLRSREGSLFTFDPFSPELTNSNMIVSGGSGAGKSYFTNSLIAQMLKSSPKVFILDVGASYRKTCENLGGQYVELGIKQGISINPFSIDGLDPSDTENWDRKIKFLVAVVELMTKDHGKPSIGRFEKAELENLIRQTLIEEPSPRICHLRARLLLHPDREITRLGKILSLWCDDSPFGRFVDRPTTIELNRDVVCFDLKNLDSVPELQSVCLLLITDLIWREVQKDKTVMKFTVFDECWKIMLDDAAAQFVGEVFRTFRKYRASAIAISQTMDDFSKSRIASAIMPNSSVKWILKQKGADQKSLQEALQLNEREMNLVASLESIKGKFSECFLMSEDKRQVVRIESTPLEYWLFTTDPADVLLLEKMRIVNPSLSNLDLLKLCSRDFPQGASTIPQISKGTQ